MKSLASTYRLLILSFVILLIACSRPAVKSYQSYVKAEEMCRILEKKRTQKTRKEAKRKRIRQNTHAIIPVNDSEFIRLSENTLLPSPLSDLYTRLPDNRNQYPELLSITDHNKLDASENPSNLVSCQDEAEIGCDSIVEGDLLTILDVDPDISTETGSFQYSEDYHFPLSLLAGALLAGLLLSTNRKSISRIAGWARDNQAKSMWAIAAIHTALIPTMTAFGNELYLQGSLIPDPVLYGSMGLLASSIALSTYKFPKKYYYTSMRALTVATALSGSLMVMHAGNHYEVQNLDQFEISTPTATFASLSAISLEERDSVNAQEPKKKGMSTGVKILLTILAILAAVGLGVLLAGLSCNIACAGYEAFAWIVFIGGNTGNVFLLIYAIKSIFGKNKKQKQRQAQPI